MAELIEKKSVITMGMDRDSSVNLLANTRSRISIDHEPKSEINMTVCLTSKIEVLNV